MISIITSLYRSDEYVKSYAARLQKTAAELEKAGIEFEVVCIANDVTPLEKSVCENLAKNPWFIFANVPRESLYATWNRGLDLAHGDIYTFWNVDDIRFAEAIIDGSNKIKSAETDIVYFPFMYKRYIRILSKSILVKRRLIVPHLFDKKIFSTTMQCGPFFMFSKSAVATIGKFDPKFKIAGDFDWCARAARQGLRFLRSDMTAGIFTNDGRSLSGSKNTLQQEENKAVLASK